MNNATKDDVAPQILTVESFVLAIDEMIRSGHLSPDAKICVQVADTTGFDGAEACYDFVTIGGFGKIAIITPFWRLAQHYDKTPNRGPKP